MAEARLSRRKMIQIVVVGAGECPTEPSCFRPRRP